MVRTCTNTVWPLCVGFMSALERGKNQNKEHVDYNRGCWKVSRHSRDKFCKDCKSLFSEWRKEALGDKNRLFVMVICKSWTTVVKPAKCQCSGQIQWYSEIKKKKKKVKKLLLVLKFDVRGLRGRRKEKKESFLINYFDYIVYLCLGCFLCTSLYQFGLK